MMINTTSRPSTAGTARRPWSAPSIQILDIDTAQGANPGPLCDKFGSLSAVTGSDRCDPATK